MATATVWGGAELLAAFAAATHLLDAHRAEIDSLNVYPVPDGDTGTNMSLTMNAALREARGSAGPDATAGQVADRIAHGALLGARGNSGVILSQIYRGFARAISDRDKIDGRDVADALKLASETAYNAVMTPVEGTMLTVIRVAAEHAVRVAGRDPSLSAVLEAALIGSREALLDTPNLLLTLRHAGVVDSGGKGLVITFEGLLAAATGQVVEDQAVDFSSALPDLTAIEGAMDHDGYGYCTNFLISGAGIPFEQVRAELSRMGQSAVIVGDEQYVKVHLHTKRPGAALDYALDWGSLSQIKIDNMDSQARKFAEIAPSQTPDEARSEVEIAVIAVASGHGIASAFRELGAADVISGGETMNPSIEEMLGAVNSSPGRAVVLLPNDGNVLMAAEQVSNLSDRPVEVIPTRTVPQGLAALSSFRPDQDLAANVSAMTRRAASALSIEVARADKNALVHDVAVQSGQFIALVDDRLVAAGDDLIDLTLATLADPIRGGPELATVFLGANLDAETRDLLEEHLVARFRDTEFEFIDGGQPHYQLVIALE